MSQFPFPTSDGTLSHRQGPQPALDAVVAKFHAHHIEAEIIGLNPHSAELHGRMTGHLTGSH